MQSVFFAFLALVLFVNIGITVLNHPFQYCYFNPVANYFLQPTNKNFEMDFWGVSFKQGIEYLLEKPNPTNKKIKVAFSCAPGKMNFYFLEKEINNRLEMVEIEDDFDYYLYIDRPGYQHLNKDWKIEKEFFCQKNVILAVYKK